MAPTDVYRAMEIVPQSIQTGARERWLEKARDCEAAAQDAVSSGDGPDSAQAGSTKHANASAARNDSDDEFPSLRRLNSEYRHKLAVDIPHVQESTAGESGEALDGLFGYDLFGYGSIAGVSQDRLFVSESDSRSGDGNDNLDNVLDLEILAFIRSADKLDDGGNDDSDNGINDYTSPRPAKRQRSASPRYGPNLHYTSTSPLSQNEGTKRSMEGIGSGDFDGAQEADIPSKRQKFSASQGSETTVNMQDRQSQHSSSPSSEDERGDRSKSISAEDHIASTARTTPTASVSSPLTGLDQEWEVRKIIGKEDVDGVPHYLVEWCPTLEPIHSLGYAKELVDEFERGF